MKNLLRALLLILVLASPSLRADNAFPEPGDDYHVVLDKMILRSQQRVIRRTNQTAHQRLENARAEAVALYQWEEDLRLYASWSLGKKGSIINGSTKDTAGNVVNCVDQMNTYNNQKAVLATATKRANTTVDDYLNDHSITPDTIIYALDGIKPTDAAEENWRIDTLSDSTIGPHSKISKAIIKIGDAHEALVKTCAACNSGDDCGTRKIGGKVVNGTCGDDGVCYGPAVNGRADVWYVNGARRSPIPDPTTFVNRLGRGAKGNIFQPCALRQDLQEYDNPATYSRTCDVNTNRSP